MNSVNNGGVRVLKAELLRAVDDYAKMLYGEAYSDLRKRRGLLLTHPQEIALFVPLLPRILRGFSPALVSKILPFARLLGFGGLRKYVKPNLSILKVQAERMQGMPVLAVPRTTGARHGKWKKARRGMAGVDWRAVRRRVLGIVDRERNAGMSSFERFHRAVLDKGPDRVPFAPLMDYFYARVVGLTVSEFVSLPYRKVARAVRFAHRVFGDYFDMVHLPMGRIYSFFQPVPVAHSGYYAKLVLPGEVGQVLQFLEEPYLKLEDFPRLRAEGFSSMWRKRPTRLVLDTLLDFFQVGEFVAYWEQERRVPLYSGSGIATPLEALSYLMGMSRWAHAMRKKPAETLAACETLLPGLLANDLLLKEFSGVKRAYICLERVSPQFLSPKYFEEFVWDHIRTIVEQNNRLGYVNLFHMDTDWGPFLHYFAELPRSGRYIFHLENTSIERARDIVGHLGPLMGNLDTKTTVFGTPKRVRARVSELIREVGADGRFILSAGCHLPPDTPVENVLAIIETVEREGWYS
ncbi:MAG: uroporphyrinogen decarboxylase family protein [Promethearchaeota archaeon]